REGSEIPGQAYPSLSKISDIAGDDFSVPGYGFPEASEEEAPAPASPTTGTRAPVLAVPVPQAAATPAPAAVKTAPALSETIMKIAEARAQYDKLSERAFTQLLFDRGIYRHPLKDATQVPLPHTTYPACRQRARDAGML